MFIIRPSSHRLLRKVSQYKSYQAFLDKSNYKSFKSELLEFMYNTREGSYQFAPL